MSANLPQEAEIAEISASPVEVAARCKADFNFLAALIMQGDYLFAFPSFYITLFHLLTAFKSRVERFAIGIPRGFAKTTWIKILVCWYVLFSHKTFILIVAASEPKAIAILADVVDMMSGPVFRRIFGNWDARTEEDNNTSKVFQFRGKDMILKAAGAQTSVRGIARKLRRPDVMILDDIQDKEDAKNKDLADALHVWMLSTLMKARSPFGCTYIYVGNMYPQNAILEKLKNNKYWTSFIVGGILADGTSLWEDLKPIDELLEEYDSDLEAGHPEVFISEILNSTDIALSSGIELSKLPHIPQYLLDVEMGEGSYILIDPSSGKKHGDDCAIMHFEVKDGLSIADEVVAGTFTSRQTIVKALELGFRRSTRLICVEDVAYQATLLENFETYCEERGITGFEFHPVAPRNQAKNNRIKRGLVRWMKGEIYVHPRIRSLVVAEVVDWNPLKTNNKDELMDLLGYAEQVESEYAEHIVRNVFDQDEPIPPAITEAELSLPF